MLEKLRFLRRRRCPYCDTAMSYKEGIYGVKYKCPSCEKTFDENLNRITPLRTDNSMALRKRVASAENAYGEAVQILSHLDKMENRELVANVLRNAGYPVEPSDLEGAKLEVMENLEGGKNVKNAIEGRRDAYFKQYGLRVYPFTIVISTEKAAGMEEKFRDKPNVRYGGINIPAKEPPFNILGGIRLSFSGKKTAVEHEDFHGTWEIYRGAELPPQLPNIIEMVERDLLDEINSFRTEAMTNFRKDLERGNAEPLKNFWSNDIKNRLSNRYISPSLNSYVNYYLKDDASKSRQFMLIRMELEIRTDIKRIIPIVIDLQVRYDESVLSRILIKSRHFEDVEEWYYDKTDVLGQWQERVIRQREMEVRKLILSSAGNRRTDPNFIRTMIIPKIREYWRFIGDPRDEAAMNRYAEKLIAEAGGPAGSKDDVAKEIGRELEKAEIAEEEKGKMVAGEIGRELRKAEMKQRKRATKEIKRELGNIK